MDAGELTMTIRQAQGGDAVAFETLINAYGGSLYGLFYRSVGNRHDAEDLLQELFLRLVRNIGRYDHRDRFDAWLYRVATNLIRDRVRKSVRLKGRFRRLDTGGDENADVVAGLSDESPGPAETLAAGEQYDDLQKALSKLPDEQREVLLLRHFSGLSFQQIAQITGCPVGTALARAHRGLQKLRQLLERT